MWNISPLTDIPLLRGGGGQPFTRFVDTLLRTQCFVYDIPQAAIATTLKVNVADGGVDTRVDQGTAGDMTGYLSVPSVWQYKAEDAERISEASVTKEIQKPYAAELVRKGFGYRLCVCDEITPEKKARLLRSLNEAAQAMGSSAPVCHIITASDLADWANRFPGLVATIFERPSTIARHWQAWHATQRAVTREYVPPDGWEDRCRVIQNHLKSSFAPVDPVLTVQGVAGVGKTRLVFEAIAQIGGAAELVVVTNDEKRAQEAAQWLVNSGQLTGILVADECSVQARFELNGLVRGHEARIRVIAIDNTGEPPPHGTPGIWIEKIALQTAEQILQQNFRVIPPERRRAYADLSGGYIRLAADLCRHDDQMHRAGSLQPAIPTLQDYYLSRIAPNEQKVVEAIALVHRIGHSEDVATQLDLLGGLAGIAPDFARETVARLKDAPGFIVATPRYYYVTPQIIAEIAFQRAWQRLASCNPAAFLDRIPEQLRPSFELRVRGLADQGVRSVVSVHFRKRVADLTPADLADRLKMGPFLDLLETDPASYLPQLTRLVVDASETDLLATGGMEIGDRGTRRELVWAAERLAIFPEYFGSAELILRQLAITETEKGIGNNATGIWRQMFRVYLSGTAIPFSERLEIFKQVILSDDSVKRELALGGLDHLVDTHVTRMGTPSVVGGRIPPSDWRPDAQAEFEDCLSRVIELAEDLLSRSEPLSGAGWGYLHKNLRPLLAWQKLDLLQDILERHPLPQSLLGLWLEQIDDFLQYEAGDPSSAPPKHLDYCARVRSWQAATLPRDFAGRLRGIVGKDLWHHSIREDIHNEESEIDPLVDEIVKDAQLLKANLGYLVSPEARSASTFGAQLGRKEPSANSLDHILLASRQARSTALLRGYVSGLLQKWPGQIDRISGLLDDLEHDDPEIAAEIIVAGLDVTDPITRLARMVGTGMLSRRYLQYLHYGGIVRQTPGPQFAEVLRVLAGPGFEAESVEIAVELIGDRLKSSNLIREPAETIVAIKDVLARSAVTEDRAAYWWRDAMEHFVSTDPEWTAAVAAEAFSGDDFQKRDHASSILSQIAATNPDAVMQVLGAALLDPQRAWRWQIGSSRGVVSVLPVDVVMDWISKVGLEGARLVARHLSSPTLGADGSPVIPELTQKVLVAYGDDAKVFREFVIGRHDMEASWGPISAHHEGHASVAKAFLNHRLPIIRKWAESELASAEASAEFWRKHEEDEDSNS